jgi:bifunctional non-homologous end joining protein LigD
LPEKVSAHSAILKPVLPKFQPMPLLKRRSAFDHPDWFFELKLDGFRALARVGHRRTQLISRNGNTFTSFHELQQNILPSLPDDSVVLDGRTRFNDLLFHRGHQCFFAFDLLFVNGKDLRTAQLSDRKDELRKLLAQLPAGSRLRYAEHIEASGTRLFEREPHLLLAAKRIH